MSAQIILRLRSPIGLNRITVNALDTFGELRLKISKTLNYSLSDFTMYTEDNRHLSVEDRYKLRDLPIMRDGAIIQIKLLKVPKTNPSTQGVTVDKIQQEKTNPKCNHPPGGKCLNCLSSNNKEPAASGINDKKEPEKVNTGKCNHGPGGKCFNCTVIDKKEKKATSENLCQHGPNAKCLHCLDSQFINDVAHMSFDNYLEEKKLKCKGVHPADVKCNNCLPPQVMRYKLDINCKNHEPYPRGMCNKCLPPSVSVGRQVFRHLDYVQFMNVKDMGNFVRNWVETKHCAEQRVAYLYGYYAEDPHYKGGIRAIVEALYEPNQKGSYNSFQILPDPFLSKVEEIANSLSLERIGWMITETNHDTFLSEQQVRTACRLQEEYFVRHSSGYPISNFFTVVMRLDEKNNGEVKPQVYMVSDQAQALEREGFFTESGSRKSMKIRPANEKQILPSFLVSGKMVTEFEPEFLIVNIGHGTSHDNKFAILKNADFPSKARKKIEKSDLKSYMLKYKSKPSCIKYSDFNLLLYLSEEFDLETACTLGHAVANESRDTGIIDQMIEQKAGL